MTFVPFVPPPASSAKASELSKQLASTIDAFRQNNPSVTPVEVRQAMHLAMSGAKTGKPAVALALGLGVLSVLLGVLVFFYHASPWPPW